MALRSLWGFDHIPSGSAIGVQASGYGLPYAGHGLIVASLDTAYASISIKNGAISTAFTTVRAGSTAWVRFPLTGLTDNTSPRSHVGFNFTRTVTVAGAQGGAELVWIGGEAVVLHSDFTAVLNVPILIELTIDRIKKEVLVYVNNKFKRRISSASIVNNYNSGGIMYLGAIAAPINAGEFLFRDFYFVDDTQDNTQCNRLGVASVAAVPITGATAVDWTTTAASILASINTPYSSTASTTTPVVSSTASKTDLVMSVTANASSLPIVGVSFTSSLAKRAGSGATATGNASIGATKLNGTTFVAANANLAYSTEVGTFAKAPGDVTWTIALLNQTKFALTPVAVDVNVRQANVYALLGVAVVRDKSKTGKQALLDLINVETSDTFTFAKVTFAPPAVNAVAGQRNTSVELTALEGAGYLGKATLKYTRYNFVEYFTDISWKLNITADTTLYAQLAAINTAYASNLTVDDVVDAVILSGASGIVMTASANSYTFVPGSTATIGLDPSSLAAVVKVKNLIGFDPS